MSKRLTVVLLSALALGACDDLATGPEATEPVFGRSSHASYQLIVTSAADAGSGTLRAALEEASMNSRVRSIRFGRGLSAIHLASSLVYSGGQDLDIDGRDGTIDASAVADGLVVTGGASLGLSNLTILGAQADGVFMEVPATATGVVTLELSDVVLRGNGEFGAHVDDQTGASAATIRLLVSGSEILDNGFAAGAPDRDGIRIDEGGEGDIVSFITNSLFSGNAADGIEYDEKGAGDAKVSVWRSHFDDNGSQPQDTNDLEDGFDIDEAGDGSVFAYFTHVTTSRNFDGGIDLDEEGAGDIVTGMYRVEAIGNTDDNIKASEDADVEETATDGDGAGGIYFRLRNVVTTDSGDNGIQFEEFGVGDVNGTIVRSRSSDNADDGVNIDQQDEGAGTVVLRASTFEGNADKNVNIDNVELIIRP